MLRPSLDSRESMTLSSRLPHLAQYIVSSRNECPAVTQWIEQSTAKHRFANRCDLPGFYSQETMSSGASLERSLRNRPSYPLPPILLFLAMEKAAAEKRISSV